MIRSYRTPPSREASEPVGAAPGSRRRRAHRLAHHLITVDYALLVFSARRLPLSLGRTWACARGVVHALVGYDWHTYATGRYKIRPLVWRSLTRMCPHWPAWRRMLALVGRYVNCSIAEWEGQALDRLLARLPAEPETIVPQAQQGTIYLLFHYGSHLVGIAWVARLTGRRTWPAASNVFIRHPGVHPSVRRLYLRQYELLDRYLNGGRVLYVEDGVRPLHQHVGDGADVMFGIDLTTKGKRALSIDFMGLRSVPFAPGAAHLAEMTGAPWRAFACRFRNGRHRLTLGQLGSDPREIHHAFRFYEPLIAARPQDWWACHILSL